MKKTTKLFKPVIVGLVSVLCYYGTAHAQPTIGNVYPNGTNMFQPSPTLTFTANSGSGVTNITVDLTATNLYTGAVILAHRTSAGGLTIAGSNVSTALVSNTLYGVTIKAFDANGSTTVSEAFDTINPIYTWEAEDFDYNTTLHFDVGTDQYAGLSGVEGTDYHNGNPGNGNASYRPKGLETENPNSGDSPLRRQFIGTTNFDYNVGWTSGGDWGNYTHAYPPGTYVMFARISGGNGPQTESGDINIVSGTATSTNATPYKFANKGRGWGAYDFIPVKDSSGNLVQFTFDGSVSTLQEMQVQAADNMNFFMLMPIPVVLPSTVTIGNVTPDGSVQFQASNTLSFTVSSPVAIDLSSVGVQLTTTTLFGSNSTALLTIGNGLSYTGNSTSITVTTPLTTNVIYSALILANDANTVQASYSLNFDTIVPAYTFEAEDWNYGGGNYMDNPAPDAFAGSGFDGVAETDFHRPSGGTLGTYNRVGLDSENCGDIHRATYINGTSTIQDYDNGNTSGGDWANYTRTFPAGTYNIFVRVARGNGGTVTDAGKISIVTGDRTQPNQTVQDLGKHDTPSTGGWQNYVWMPIMNNGGFPARFVADGTVKTLRYTFDGAGDNINFVMLLPAVGGNPPPFVTGFTPDGSSLFQPSNSLTFVVNSSVGIPQSGVTLNLNGVNVTGLTFSGSSTLWNVSYPVKTNGFYTAIITLTDSAGTTSFTNSFTTFDSGNYQFEAEDYDYGGGLYMTPENQVDAYAGLGGNSGVDYFEADPNGPGRGENYRAATSTAIPDAVANDQPRAQFTPGTTDYNIGSFGVGSWANYTRHYPAGTYNVIGRFTEGAGLAGAALATLSGSVSNLVGTFAVQNEGWSTWQWQELMDASGSPAQVIFDGSAQTLQLSGTTGNEVNVNFLMLVATVPKPKITVTVSGGNVHLSFLTQNGYSYQVLYKDNLSDATWTPLGSALSGNGAVQSASDPTSATGHRFYRVQVQ